MRLSARNILTGKVLTVIRGATTAHVKVEVAPGQIITSSITNEAVDELGLMPGQIVKTIIKSSDVIIGID